MIGDQPVSHGLLPRQNQGQTVITSVTHAKLLLHVQKYHQNIPKLRSQGQQHTVNYVVELVPLLSTIGPLQS